MVMTVEELIECVNTWATLLFQNNLQKFFEDLFRHVLEETEGLNYTSQLNYFPLVLEMYQNDLGSSIIQILGVAGANIDQLFESMKEKLRVRENLRSFLVSLADKFLCGSPQHELYFLTIASRIFALMFRTNVLTPDMFIEELVQTIVEHASRVGETNSLPTLNIESLIGDILNNFNSIDEFRNLKCGEVSDYFLI